MRAPTARKFSNVPIMASAYNPVLRVKIVRYTALCVKPGSPMAEGYPPGD
jgi:hypothetical protein